MRGSGISRVTEETSRTVSQRCSNWRVTGTIPLPRVPSTPIPWNGAIGIISVLLLSTLSRRPPDESKREDYRAAAGSIARGRMQDIVGNQHRKDYQWAASVMVALIEVRALTGAPEDGVEVVRGAREEFPRHSVFRRELNALIAASPALPDVEV